jgi:hypothetical protein
MVDEDNDQRVAGKAQTGERCTNEINRGFPKNAVRKSAICFVSVSGGGVGKSTDVSGVPQYTH